MRLKHECTRNLYMTEYICLNIVHIIILHSILVHMYSLVLCHIIAFFHATVFFFQIDLLLICGDFQSVRNHSDLQAMAVPQKYQHLESFWK